MTNEWLSTGETNDIADFIAGCECPDNALFLGEQQPTHVVKLEDRQNLLLFVDYKPTLPFAAYTSGRIFHRDFELRWQQNVNGGTQVVYLGTPEYRPAALPEGEPIEMQEPRQYYLFGTRIQTVDLQKIGPPAQEGDFAEIRVPRLLRYPRVPKNAQRMRIVISESIDKQTGRIEQYRFLDVIGEPS